MFLRKVKYSRNILKVICCFLMTPLFMWWPFETIPVVLSLFHAHNRYLLCAPSIYCVVSKLRGFFRPLVRLCSMKPKKKKKKSVAFKMKNEHQDELLSMLIFRHEERAREERDIGERNTFRHHKQMRKLYNVT